MENSPNIGVYAESSSRLSALYIPQSRLPPSPFFSFLKEVRAQKANPRTLRPVPCDIGFVWDTESDTAALHPHATVWGF